MHVLMFEQRFVEPILAGDKVHTIRGSRKRPIRRGDVLSLRYWEGKAYRSKQRELFRGPCIAVSSSIVFTRRMLCFPTFGTKGIFLRGPQMEEFAKSDGFATWREMRHYWESRGGLEAADQIILWGVHPLFESMLPNF